MNDTGKFVPFAVKLAAAIEQCAQTGRVDDSDAHFTNLITEIIPALPAIKAELADMSGAKKAGLVAAVKTLGAPDGNPERVVDLALLLVGRIIERTGESAAIVAYLLIVIADYLQNVGYFLTAQRFDVVNPRADFWFQRVDGQASHQFGPGGMGEFYLCNSIPVASPAAYFNSEIYNSPYTSLRPKNVLINTFPVDPRAETYNSIYDLFLNLPFVVSQGVIFEGRISVENLRGGSRGWGFWNTSVLPWAAQIAWFIQIEGTLPGGREPMIPSGFYAQTLNGLNGLFGPDGRPNPQAFIRLPDLDEQAHDYRIELNESVVEYFIDGRSVARVTDPALIPASPLAFHNWVDNAFFNWGRHGPSRNLQETFAPRANTTWDMKVRTSNRLSPAYTNRLDLAQTRSPEGLSAWLSSNHPDYDLVAWCFFGYLQGTDGSGQPVLDALSSIVQFNRNPLPTPGRYDPGYVAAFAYNGEATNGYLVAGTLGTAPSPSLDLTPSPWSAAVNYGTATAPSAFTLSLASGQMGVKGATYRMQADALDFQQRRLKAEILLVDRLGTINEGYGTAAFLPQWMTPAQQAAIRGQYAGNIQAYLARQADPMKGQGTYYYSLPLLEVQHFKVTGPDEMIYAQGHGGMIWVDSVVQSYNQSEWKTLGSASWVFFSVQFPGMNTALMVSVVFTIDPVSELPTAKYFTAGGPKTLNGALSAEREWVFDQIAVMADPASAWRSPASGVSYPMSWRVELGAPTDLSSGGAAPDWPVFLTIDAVRNNQEIYIAGDPPSSSKYEGIFRVQGRIGGRACEGMAWGELHNAEAGTQGYLPTYRADDAARAVRIESP